jgi:hypothetical protein
MGVFSSTHLVALIVCPKANCLPKGLKMAQVAKNVARRQKQGQCHFRFTLHKEKMRPILKKSGLIALD